MFKIKKNINEKNTKKDFFKVKNINNYFFNFDGKINIESFYNVNCLSEIELPKKNNSSFILTHKISSTTEIIKKADECIIFCNAINLKYIIEVKDKIKGILIRNTIIKNAKKEIDFAKKNNIKLKFINNHSKILLLKKGSEFFVLQGSGNPSVNEKNENYMIINNNEYYDVLYNFWNNA